MYDDYTAQALLILFKFVFLDFFQKSPDGRWTVARPRLVVHPVSWVLFEWPSGDEHPPGDAR